MAEYDDIPLPEEPPDAPGFPDDRINKILANAQSLLRSTEPSPQPARRSTVISSDAIFKGELFIDGELVIEGKFEGKLNGVGRVYVARQGKMQADVEVSEIFVEGDVRGHLSAERIHFHGTATYEGDLRTTKLVVDEGSILSGNFNIGPEVHHRFQRPPLGSVPRPQQAAQKISGTSAIR